LDKAALKRFAKGGDDGKRSDLPQKKKLNAEERKALAKLKFEAKKRGATLHNGGEGGLPPSLVWHILRRDKFECKACGTNKDLTLHHKGGIVGSKWLSKQGHKTTPENLVVLCNSCHSKMHEEAREEGVDSSQVLPEGDKGDPRRDHGQPDAQPKK